MIGIRALSVRLRNGACKRLQAAVVYPMTTPTSFRSGPTRLFALFVASTAFLAAQVVAPSGTAVTAKEEAVTLTAFEVKADESDTYQATNTNSVTGTNTALSKT